MPKTKVIETEKPKKDSVLEKLINPDEVESVLEIDEKIEPIVPVTEEDEDSLEDDPLLDTEEIDPFGDTWEQ